MGQRSLQGRHFLSVSDLNNQELTDVLELAIDLKRRVRAGIHDQPHVGKTLGLVFQKPSLRTRVSFAVAFTQLGGNVVYLSPQEIGMGTREDVDDVGLVLSRFFDVIAARVFEHEILEELAAASSIPIVNALSAGEHPCQALGDLLTIREWKGTLKGLTVTYIGDGNNVAASLALACMKVGTNFRIATPKGYALPQKDVDKILGEARATGATLDQSNDPRAAATGADVIYTDVWTSMGQEAESAKRLKDFEGFKITEALVALGNEAIVMHCLPAHYPEEIDKAVTRLPCSAIWDQAENRLHAQKALLSVLV